MHRAFDVFRWICFFAAFAAAAPTYATQVLARVGNIPVTAAQLEAAINSSPVASQFPGMSADEQAALRGSMLKRLVAANLLYLEALKEKLDQTPQFVADLTQYREGLLLRTYMDRLRESIRLSDEELRAVRDKYRGEPDALTGAKAAIISERYRAAKAQRLRDLRDRFHLRLHDERLVIGVAPQTELAVCDGFAIRFADISDGRTLNKEEDLAYYKERLYDRTELLLVALAAERDGIDVSEQLDAYRHERLPSLLLDKMARQWIPDEATARTYFEAHPDIGRIAERRHVGQLVVATRKEANALLQRILNGESLFELAGQFSIDPYGRNHNGDMGWLRAGTGSPEIEKVLERLPDNQVSEVIETPKGFHLVMIINRAKGSQMRYEEVADRVRQAIMDDHLPAYIDQLRDRYGVEWLLPMQQGTGLKGVNGK